MAGLLVETRARIAARVVGRERELELILAAVAAGRAPATATSPRRYPGCSAADAE